MLRTTTTLLLSISLLTACPPGDDDDSGPTPEPVPDFVLATVRVTDAETGALFEGVDVAFDDQAEVTDSDGRADVTVPTLEPFEITLSADGFADHVLTGVVGGADFIFPFGVSSSAFTDTVLTSLGLVADPAKGTLVVSLDTVALQAASGSSTSIDSTSDAPYIFVNGVAQAGSELIFEAEAFVTFPNVDPGPVTVSIVPPEDDVCLGFPALDATDDLRTFDVAADTVTVVDFICQ